MCDTRNQPADDTPWGREHDELPVKSVAGNDGRPVEAHSVADGDGDVSFKRRRPNKKKPWKALQVFSPVSEDRTTAPRTSKQIPAAPDIAASPMAHATSCEETQKRPLSGKKSDTNKEVRVIALPMALQLLHLSRDLLRRVAFRNLEPLWRGGQHSRVLMRGGSERGSPGSPSGSKLQVRAGLYRFTHP